MEASAPMANRFALTLALGATLCACHRDGGASGSDAATASSAASAPSPGGACLAQLDFLVPYQAYKNSDLFRAITVDGDHVFFRNADNLFRVPLAGGSPAVVASTPGLTLEFDARPTIWVVGDKLVSQTPGEPVFVEAPKSGGTFTPIVNLAHDTNPGSRSTGQQVLHDIFSGTGVHAHPAIFDGTAFYWVEVSSGRKGKRGSSIRAVPLVGGAERTLYEWEGELRSLAKAGDRLVFERTEPNAPAEKEGPGHAKQKEKPLLGASHPSYLMSMPAGGGNPETLAHFSNMAGNIGTGEVVLTDGDTVYVSGFENEDFMKAGLYRISATGHSALERLDDRHINGQGFVYGDRIVFAGQGPLEPHSNRSANPLANNGVVVLTGDRHAKSLDRAACIQGNYTTHAYAVAGKTLFIAIFNDDDKRTAIVRVPLP
jgi:hypothetical protein